MIEIDKSYYENFRPITQNNLHSTESLEMELWNYLEQASGEFINPVFIFFNKFDSKKKNCGSSALL